MTKLILIRHGETDWNTEGRWQGQIDLPLNTKGREQAAQIARSLAGNEISVIYSSDLKRAQETAKMIGNQIGLPVQIDRRLREIHQGDWQGLLISEIIERYADAFEKRHENPFSVAPPGGETAQEVQNRVIPAIEQIIHEHPDETVVVVSHGFVIAVIRTYYEHIPFEQVWDLVPGNANIQSLDISH